MAATSVRVAVPWGSKLLPGLPVMEHDKHDIGTVLVS